VKARHLLIPAIFLASVLLFSFRASSGDVYKWKDKDGVVHYTDDADNIPSNYKNQATKAGLPSISTYHEEESSSPLPEGDNGLNNQGDNGNIVSREKSAEQVDFAIATLENEIKAKVDLIEYVDGKKNLAINPLRNRVISENDQSLYKKYKKELPGDRKRLEELYSLKEQLEVK